MSTAWYVVDDEGNIGIVDYDDDGPVPWGTRETVVEEIVFGPDEIGRDGKPIKFNLTDQQVLDLHKGGHTPTADDYWWDATVRIDPKKEERFLEICSSKSKHEIENVSCISKDLHLYIIDAHKCTETDKTTKKDIATGAQKTLLDENIILEILEKPYYWEDIAPDGDLKSPYYIFSQRYSPDGLAIKITTPAHPVKIDQVPACFKERIHQIPGLFNEMASFQIAQHHPCEFYSSFPTTHIIDGTKYTLTELENGEMGYVKSSINKFPFKDFCPKNNHPECDGECNMQCYNFNNESMTAKPTVLLVIGPFEENLYGWKHKTDPIAQRCAEITYISAIPCIEKTGLKIESDLTEYLTRENLLDTFRKTKGHFEKCVASINPRVIISTQKGYEALEEIYGITERSITIAGTEYPIYQFSAIEDNRAEIERLAKLPYRGSELPLVISEEEMNRLLQEGKAK